MKKLWHTEKKDLSLLSLCVFTVVVTWIVFFGWTFTQFVAAGDALSFEYYFLTELFNVGGDWTKLIYRANVVGGIGVHDVLGTFPIHQFLGRLGIGPLAGLNISVFFVQVLYAFISIKTVIALAENWKRSDQKIDLGLLAKIALIWIFAFAPVLEWRLIYGHEIFFSGLFLYLCIISMLVTLQAGQFTLTSLALCVVALVSAFPSYSQQMVIYGLIFGFPILWSFFASFLKKSKSWQQLFIPIFCILGAIGLSMPKLAGMLQQVFGSDASRALSGNSVIYSYTTATLMDWITSIPWSYELFTSGRKAFLHHETNYAFGPFLLLLGLLSGKKTRGLLLALFLSACVAILFSMNIAPVAQWLTTLFPMLHGFRVPARAILPFAVILPIIAVALLLVHVPSCLKDKPNRVSILGTIGFALLLWISPPPLRECLIWSVTLVLIIMIKKQSTFKGISFGLIAVLFAVATLASFQQRLMPFQNEKEIIDNPSVIKRNIYKAKPALQMPLNRVFLLNRTKPNQHLDYGLSSINGYSLPTRRFGELIYTLANQPYDKTINTFNFKLNSPWFPVLQNLYNIVAVITINNNNVFIKDLTPSLGPAWFSQAIIPVKNLKTLTRQLMQHRTTLRRTLKESVLIDRKDPNIESLLPTLHSRLFKCKEAKVLTTHTKLGGQHVDLQVTSPDLCPLTLSMNYTSRLIARGVTIHGETKRLRLFPAYGALTGILVPKGIQQIVISADAFIPGWAKGLFYLGLFFIVLAIIFFVRYSTKKDPA